MKNSLRIALAPLAELGPGSLLPFAWFDRRGRCARQGELTLHALGQAYPQAACEAVLHPADVIAATVQVPAVAKARFAAAVRGALEPLVLISINNYMYEECQTFFNFIVSGRNARFLFEQEHWWENAGLHEFEGRDFTIGGVCSLSVSG